MLPRNSDAVIKVSYSSWLASPVGRQLAGRSKQLKALPINTSLAHGVCYRSLLHRIECPRCLVRLFLCCSRFLVFFSCSIFFSPNAEVINNRTATTPPAYPLTHPPKTLCCGLSVCNSYLRPICLACHSTLRLLSWILKYRPLVIGTITIYCGRPY